jgi:hypothetical protein
MNKEGKEEVWPHECCKLVKSFVKETGMVSAEVASYIYLST